MCNKMLIILFTVFADCLLNMHEKKKAAWTGEHDARKLLKLQR